MKKPDATVLGCAVFCLLLSGVAGLVYEIVWARYLALFLGHTSYAVISVLIAFMGGLAIGNSWLGKSADSSLRPLALYAWLEIGIGLYALIFPFYFEVCRDAFISLAGSLTPGSMAMHGTKFMFSLLTVLLPTVLMGGTLPILTKRITRSLGELRQRVAALYFVNSVGAVLGCLLADFWLIPSVGLQSTVWAGAALNLVVGAVALFVSGWIGEGKTPEPAARPKPAGQEQETYTNSELRLAIIGIGLSGFVAMLYEVVWTRLLALALGSSTHAFSLMLITFITGLAAGAGVVYGWKSLRRSLDAFAWAEIALASTLFGSLLFYDRLPYWFMRMAGFLVRQPESYPVYALLQVLICFVVMLVPALCLGMTLPMISRIATAELSRTGRSVGTVFSVNTLGTVLGAAVTGLWLMPWLGLAKTLALGITLNACLGILVLMRRNAGAMKRALAGSLMLAPVFVWFAGAYFDSTWQPVLMAGLWRRPVLAPSYSQFRDQEKEGKTLYYRDGAGSSVSVIDRLIEGTNHSISLRVNGKPDASSTADMSTQLLCGHIPLLLHPESERALVIGLGSGVTAGAVLQHPTIGRVDTVEISPEVGAAARFFGEFNNHALDNPRLRLWLEDAKTFLQSTTNLYDVIVSEPSNPWMAGVAGVFSREYYETCAQRLRTNGLMAQWVQVYETSNEALRMVLATFTGVFPYTSVWQGAVGDLILVGSLQPIKVDFSAVEQRFRHPSIRSDLERIDLFRVPVFLARELVSQQNTAFIVTNGAPQHSDFYPVLEYIAQKAFFVRAETDLYSLYDENVSTRPTTFFGEYLKQHPLTESDLKACALFYNIHHLPEGGIYRTVLDRWMHAFPDSIMPVEFSARLGDAQTVAELQAVQMMPYRERIFQMAEKQPELLRRYSQFLLQAYRAHRSAFYTPTTTELEATLERLVAVDVENRRVHLLRRAELAWDRGDDEGCVKLGQAAFDPDVGKSGPIKWDLDPKAPARGLSRMIETFWRSGRIVEAWGLCEQAERNRYLGPSAKVRDGFLELTYRKVKHAVENLSPAGRS